VTLATHLAGTVDRMLSAWRRHRRLAPVRAAGPSAVSVDSYWTQHTVNSTPFSTAEESERYLSWRFEQYPLFREYMGLWGDHDQEVVLDYGCGPGDDLVGFLLYTGARKVIGIDVSSRALGLSRGRLELHKIDPARYALAQTSDTAVELPVQSQSVGYVNCGGVLHHTSRPDVILHEFHRVLKPGSVARIMVYNRNSVWFHLYTAYIRLIVDNAFPGLDADQAFSRTTDGEHCPISRSYRPSDFLGLLKTAGFDAEFVGGYLSLHELTCLDAYGLRALDDPRLANEHREFLQTLRRDERGLPMHAGMHAGIGGVYVARRT
jgi:ubiquinone/menaquinone biosynthesis C-methylase UbiE